MTLSRILGQYAALAALIVATIAPAQRRVQACWFVQAGAVGDGTSIESPSGSMESIDRLSRDGHYHRRIPPEPRKLRPLHR